MNTSDILLFIFSISFLVLSLYLYVYRVANKSRHMRVFTSCVTMLFGLLSVFYAVAYFFTGEGITSTVWYFLRYGVAGAGFSAYSSLIIAALFTLFGLVLLCIGIYLVPQSFPVYTGSRAWHAAEIVVTLLIISILLHPTTIAVAQITKLTYGPSSPSGVDYFERHYQQPHIIPSGEPMNLVFIYAEGLERTYFNESLFPGLITHLKDVESRSVSFTDIEQDGYSHHTMGGIIASQCGIPLIAPSHANSMSGVDQYLPGATCLGDLLSGEGYALTYQGGAEIDFAGKGNFFRTHSFDQVEGIEELKSEVNESYVGAWGLFDDMLFNISFNSFVAASQNDRPFAHFLLTLDTHHPNGEPSKSCDGITYEDGSNSMLNAMKCSDMLISDFVSRIRASPYSQDTIIVIASDHMGLRNTATPILEGTKRKNLLLINTPDDQASSINTPGLTMDTGATLLPFIGFSATLGLGRNLATLPSQKRRDEINFFINDFSSPVVRFWEFPTIQESITIDPFNKTFNIDTRSFELPVLVELDEYLNTQLHFEFGLPEEKNLNSQLSNVINERFILIEDCTSTNEVTNQNNTAPYCAVFGHKSNRNVVGLNNTATFTTEQVLHYLDS